MVLSSEHLPDIELSKPYPFGQIVSRLHASRGYTRVNMAEVLASTTPETFEKTDLLDKHNKTGRTALQMEGIAGAWNRVDIWNTAHSDPSLSGFGQRRDASFKDIPIVEVEQRLDACRNLPELSDALEKYTTDVMEFHMKRYVTETYRGFVTPTKRIQGKIDSGLKTATRILWDIFRVSAELWLEKGCTDPELMAKTAEKSEQLVNVFASSHLEVFYLLHEHLSDASDPAPRGLKHLDPKKFTLVAGPKVLPRQEIVLEAETLAKLHLAPERPQPTWTEIWKEKGWLHGMGAWLKYTLSPTKAPFREIPSSTTVTTGCPALYAKREGHDESVAAEMFQWILRVAKRWYFPRVAELAKNR